MRMIDVFPSLIEITLERLNRGIEERSINAILARNGTFEKLNILSCRLDESQLNNLEIRLENDWNISVLNCGGAVLQVDLSFERKHQ